MIAKSYLNFRLIPFIVLDVSVEYIIDLKFYQIHTLSIIFIIFTHLFSHLNKGSMTLKFKLVRVKCIYSNLEGM